MPSLNKVQIIGYLGKDPEMRTLSTGRKVTSFSVAVSRRWKNKDGHTEQATEWINAETWGRLAEICNEYLSKGSLVYIEGRLKTDQYEKGGETRYITKVVAHQMQMLDRKPTEEEAVFEEPAVA